MKYLLEIRNRLILIFLTWLFLVAVSYFYKETLLFLVLHLNKLAEATSESHSFYFIFTNVTEIFSVYVQLILFLSVQVVLIVFLYHCFNFLSLAMFDWEYNLVVTFLKLSFSVWCFSVISINCFLVPLTWSFFFSFQKLATDRYITLHFEAKLNEYLDFYMSLYYLCVFYCQIFAIIIFFISFVNFSFAKIKRFRKLYYYIFVLLSTLLSPPDIISQVLISFLLIFTYEILIVTFIVKTFLTRQSIKRY